MLFRSDYAELGRMSPFERVLLVTAGHHPDIPASPDNVAVAAAELRDWAADPVAYWNQNEQWK